MLMRCEKQLRTRCAQLEETLEATADTSVDSVETPEKEESRTTLEHLRCLLSFIDTDIKSRMDYLNNDPRCTKVSFADVWYLFKPGDEVIHKSGKAAYRVLEVSSPSDHATPWLNSKWRGGDDGETPDTSYFVTCVAIDFDGKFFGPVKWGPWEIEKFRGEKPINTFDVYPIRFYGRDAKSSSVGENTGDAPWQILRRQLVERGILFALTASVRHMYYAGPIIDTKEEIESQVVIDCGEAFNGNYTGSQKPVLDLLIGEDSSPMREKKPCVAACCFGEVIEPDFHIDRLQKDEYINSLIPVQENTLPSVTIYRRSLEATKTPGSELTEGELLITNFRVYGFILRSRTWAMLDLTYLSDIETINKAGESVDATDRHRKSAFDRLVLPDEHKRLIHSLVAQHFRDKQRQNRTTEDEQMDIVRGKGKGLVLLLHGAPGVGKTSTAEAVAERFKKPLFQITCGDLGSTAKEVEDALSKNFALANKWGCILLLDEADVFLATRKREDFTRNGLVAVFLRVLEYYAGVLFLTTNRIGDFDEAFTSRIHMSLYYPPLNEYSTKKVFELNLEMISERFRRKGRRIIVEESQIFSHIKEYFEKHEHARWNGRQIRNSCQTALALAEYDAQGSGDQSISTEIHLRQGHFKIVSDAYLDFIQYLKTVRNTLSWQEKEASRANSGA
ncbi:P-loop containing nucleoside triphosphate hydrolase protein [Podospora aff. communis PSN243]|uniref:P-loop containing nucleoside triphosphate hydrolase protein n=1 Tax=Podospora aff. communis PSN243 TaxID=3040156 RepID=A0AAV9H139_9PEZI|nr:P-loop containing nucleoside triphosphate hydrolase protein [Podospora aff. communis PSN243]